MESMRWGVMGHAHQQNPVASVAQRPTSQCPQRRPHSLSDVWFLLCVPKNPSSHQMATSDRKLEWRASVQSQTPLLCGRKKERGVAVARLRRSMGEWGFGARARFDVDRPAAHMDEVARQGKGPPSYCPRPPMGCPPLPSV
ncbi:hypothetical protein WJX84_011883 [Apatococcus fuscideae]|uniref:Uncharacterized protein n=1 Tax=Apatococcus fuscideae TaxID=2026836 RepID=A0AAW1TDT2_9CHLO